MKPMILIVEDSEYHLNRLCSLIYNLSIEKGKLNELDQKGSIILSYKNESHPEYEYDFVLCNNRESAETTINENSHRIIYCLLDLILPEDKNSKDITSKIFGEYVLELLQNDDIFTFIISTDKDSLKTLFDESKLIQRKERTQFIYKHLLSEDEYLAEYYARLIRSFILLNLESTKWKLISSTGNFKGIDHVVELYQKILSTNDEKFKIEAEKHLTIKSNSNFQLNVSTEYYQLKNILIQFPGLEVSRVNPSNKDELLFDQPVDYNRFREQYRNFYNILIDITSQNGGRIYQLRELLMELLSNDSLGQYNICLFLLNLVYKKYLTVDQFWELIVTKPETLIEIAISGKNPENGNDYLAPVPNLLFTRDNIVSIHDKLFLPPMTKNARKRENILLEFILLNHPDFKSYYAKDFKVNDKDSFEGGDFLLFDESTLLIGISDRTSIGALKDIMEYVFNKIESIKTVVGINASLQHERSMHLDTYMGVIGDYVLLFKNPLLSIKNNTFYIFRKKTHGFETEIILGDFKDLLYKLGKQIEIIEVSEEREAYDDACNVLTVSPNKILTYDRGQKTIALLGEKGFLKVIFDEDQKMWILYGYKNAEWEYINTYSDIKSFMKIDSKLIFEIPGSELILARGGCHCMSMPLTRI